MDWKQGLRSQHRKPHWQTRPKDIPKSRFNQPLIIFRDSTGKSVTALPLDKARRLLCAMEETHPLRGQLADQIEKLEDSLREAAP